MSIRAKVISCFLAVLCLFGSVSVYSYLRARQSNSQIALVNDLFLPLSRQVAQLQSNMQGLAEDIRRFYFHADTTPENSTFSRMVRDLYPYLIRKKFAAADHLLSKYDKGELNQVAAELSAMLQQTRNVFDDIAAASDKEKFESLYHEMRNHLQAISRRLDDECQRITLAAQREGKDNLITSLFLSVVVVLFGMLTVLASHRALAPLPTLISSIKKIADGDFNQSLKVKTSDKDEIGLLAREYNRMLGALSERDRKIQNQQKELLQSERLAAVGQLSAEVVHEIRNPLNAINLNIDWLENELCGGDAEVAKTLKSVSREIERLHQITESYLVRARVPPQESSRTGVHELIREILDFSREEDRSRSIEVMTELAPQEIFLRTVSVPPEAGAAQCSAQRPGGDAARRADSGPDRGEGQHLSHSGGRLRPWDERRDASAHLPALFHHQAERHRARPDADANHRRRGEWYGELREPAR